MNGPPFSQSCVAVSVERVVKDEDADENVDADQTRMERLVSGQPTGSFTQLEEMDTDFRVSRLPHAIVKQKKIESHPHREALQADLQQNNVYNPFSNNSKAMIREMGNVELFKLCETIPKVQCSQCLLYWNQGVPALREAPARQEYRFYDDVSNSFTEQRRLSLCTSTTTTPKRVASGRSFSSLSAP